MIETRQAMLYEPLPEQRVRCNLCSHRCTIRPGHEGICLVRENRDGQLLTRVYGRVIAQNVDPIEKKPLFHFHPGSTAFSVATVGCNFHCDFCQNWEISQALREEHFLFGYEASPQQIVRTAQRYGSQSIAYTYTEPTIFFEYAFDTAKLAREAGITNVFVSNGYMTHEALEVLQPYLDGINVDLKSFSDTFYRRIAGARLQPVLDSLKKISELGIWLEVTTLLIPGQNDSEAEVRQIASFISKELGPGVPWHISRFHPCYQMDDVPVTPATTLRQARDIGSEEGLHYVYEGNVPGSKGESTYCYSCNRMLIERIGYQIRSNHIRAGKCPDCGVVIDGVGM